VSLFKQSTHVFMSFSGKIHVVRCRAACLPLLCVLLSVVSLSICMCGGSVCPSLPASSPLCLCLSLSVSLFFRPLASALSSNDGPCEGEEQQGRIQKRKDRRTLLGGRWEMGKRVQNRRQTRDPFMRCSSAAEQESSCDCLLRLSLVRWRKGRRIQCV